MNNPLADLIGLTDDEIRAIAQEMHGLLTAGDVDVDEVRRLLADWALTVRIRSHPAFDANAAIFTESMAAAASGADND